MKRNLLVLLFLAVFLAGYLVVPVQADGIIIPCKELPCPLPPIPPCGDIRPCPPPPHPIPIAQLAIRYHHVTVKIANQVAVTHVDQVFHNPNSFQVEGTYIFPLPADAAVTNFVLWEDGKPVKGEILSAEQARKKYEEIVSSLRDPALLEYAGRGAVQAQIFPIPPDGERRVELEYTQTLAAENGLVRYVYPLNTEKFSVAPLENVSVTVDVTTSQPIRAVYSLSHNVAIDKQSDIHVVASYEAEKVKPDTDFSLYYSVGTSEAFHLLTYRDPSDPVDPDGFFLLLLAPRPDTAQKPLPKDIFLVLDRSGSMEGEKFRQVQAAARFVLGHLNPEDRFSVMTFNASLDSFASGLSPASQAPQASAWVDKQSAQGSTDINLALLSASGMVDSTRPSYLLFLTDGLPTQGVVDNAQILKNVAASAPKNLRLFVFGVGYDVDTYLLDSLAQEHHGSSTYVQPGQALDEILSAFYARISTPVLTDLSLDFGSIPTYDLYPQPLPDLFLGSQIIAVGRYHSGGGATLTLKGQVEGQTQTFSFPDQIFALDNANQSAGSDQTLAAIPRLWATRKIGYLLNQVRLQGADQETIDQIVRLSIRFGIVTPYTSYLVTDPTVLGAEAQSRAAQQAYDQMQAAPAAPSSGANAVQKAAGEGAMAGANQPAAPQAAPSTGGQSSDASANPVRIVGAKTFVDNEGVWTDTTFDPQKMATLKVPFLSNDYFALAQASPEIGAALALGEKVIVVYNLKAYEVVPSDQSAAPLTLPTVAEGSPTTSVHLPAVGSGSTPGSGYPAVTPGPGTGNPVETPAAPATPAPKTKGGLPLCGSVLLPLGVLLYIFWRSKLRG